MNRTNEFFSFLNKFPYSNISPSDSQHFRHLYIQYSLITKEIKQRIQHAHTSIHELFVKLGRGNILGEDENEMNSIIIDLNRDLEAIERKIFSINGIKSKPKNYKIVMGILQENLSDVTKYFQRFLKRRSDLTVKVQQRRQNLTSSIQQTNDFSTMYTSEIEIPMNSYNTQQIQETRERYDISLSVERSISEITLMYKKLSELIATQEYDIQRIDDNANDAANNISTVVNLVENHYNLVRNNRRTFYIFITVLFVFLLILILIL